MQNYPTKVDGISVLPAAEYNNLTSELKNVVTTSGQTLSTAEVYQLAKAVANYVANGTYYTDNGVADAYNLTVVGAKVATTGYVDGLTARFKVGSTNTGASTVNVASLGIKNIKKNAGADDLAAGDLTANQMVTLIYQASGDYFLLAQTEFVGKDYLNKDDYAVINTGYGFNLYDMGNSGTGTKTPLLANGFIQTLTINGNFTLAAPTESESGWIELRTINDGTGGYTINTSAYTVVQDNYDDSASKVNLFRILKVGATSYLFMNPVPMTSGGGTSSGSASGGASYVNPIINGSMAVWQRRSSATSVANNTYVADRWKYIKSGSMVHTVERSTSRPTPGADANYMHYSMSVLTTTGSASISATDYVGIEQRIEGHMFQSIAQKDFTISFWVKSSQPGLYSVAFVNKGGDRSMAVTYVISGINTWEKKVINVGASPSSGTWDYLNDVGLRVIFTIAAGSNYSVSPNVWSNGLYYAGTGQTNGCASNGNEFGLTGVQIENGLSSSVFIVENFTDTLDRCQRYYQKSYNYDIIPGTASGVPAFIIDPNGAIYVGNGQTATAPQPNGASQSRVNFAVNMRTSPTITSYNGSNGNSGVIRNLTTNANIDVNTNGGSDNGFFWGYPTGSGTTVGNAYEGHYVADAEL
jgi:hypothetical protein